MKVRFMAEIIDDNGKVVKAPVRAETVVPDVSEYGDSSKFYQVFDRFEKPVIETRDYVAAELAKEYLECAAFLKGGGKEPKS